MLGTFLRCNFFQVYSSDLPDSYSTAFTSQSCLSAGLLIFEILGAAVALFQIVVVMFACYSFIPISQVGIFGLYDQWGYFLWIILQCIPFNIVIFTPDNLNFIGYLVCAITCSVGIIILLVEHPAHSWIQGGIIGGYFTVRLFWSLFLGIYEVVLDVLSSSWFPIEPIRDFANTDTYTDILGVVFFFVSLGVALLLGAAAFGILAAYYLRIIYKVRKLFKAKKQEMEEEENEDAGNNPAKDFKFDQHEKSFSAKSGVSEKNGAADKKEQKGFLFKIISQLLGNNVSNFEFVLGMQLLSGSRNIDAAVFEDLVHDRVLDDLKKDNNAMVLSFVVFLLTRKKMEKMKIVSPQPALSELLMILFKRAEGKATGTLSKTKVLAIESEIFFFFCFFFFEKNNYFFVFFQITFS